MAPCGTTTWRRPIHIDKAEVLAILRSRGQQARADWVDHQLPPLIDTRKNASLLRMLDIDAATMCPVDPPPD
jgi:hypothetical protein